MNKTIKNICEALDKLSDFIIRSTNEQRPLHDVFGWHHPPLTRDDLANIPAIISTRLKGAKLSEIDDILEKQLDTIPTKVKILHSQTVAQMFNGNGNQAIPSFIVTMQWIENLTNQLFGFEYLNNTQAMPSSLVRRIRSLNTQIDNISIDKNELEEKIKLINDATSAAETLPIDLESLKEARIKIDKNLTDIITERGKIKELMDISQIHSYEIKINKEKTDKLVDNCEDAYRITTSKGLAGAFEQRAGKLSLSMWSWVIGLLIALGIGSDIGADRLKLLTASIGTSEMSPGAVTLQIVLSILSIGAPLWFAWLATKQIGQRFRLAEDYAYKASVAKAYEGYRKEAARIDEALEARLFNSTLARVEEAPLRLIENESHGSPWHELITSDAFQNALKEIPELKDKFIEIAKNGIQATTTITSEIRSKKTSNVEQNDTKDQ